MTPRDLSQALQELKSELDRSAAVDQLARGLTEHSAKTRDALRGLPAFTPPSAPAELTRETRVLVEALKREYRREIRRLHLKRAWRAIRWYVFACLLLAALGAAAVLSYPYLKPYAEALRARLQTPRMTPSQSPASPKPGAGGSPSGGAPAAALSGPSPAGGSAPSSSPAPAAQGAAVPHPQINAPTSLSGSDALRHGGPSTSQSRPVGTETGSTPSSASAPSSSAEPTTGADASLPSAARPADDPPLPSAAVRPSPDAPSPTGAAP